MKDGERLPMEYLFFFLGAEPCTHWLPETIKRDEKGFIVTGEDAGAEGCSRRASPGSSPPAISARIDQALRDRGRRGRAVVRYVHERLNAVPA